MPELISKGRLRPGQPSARQLAFAAANGAWEIDPTDGDDSASGLSGAPWATMTPYLQRVGPALVTGTHAITLIAGDDPLLLLTTPAVGPGGAFNLTGEPEVLRTSTFTAVAAYTPGTPATTATVTDSALSAQWSDSGAGGTSLFSIGKRIRNTTQSLIAWGQKDKGSKVLAINRTSAPFVSGNAYVVERLPVITTVDFSRLDIAPGGSISISGVSITDGRVPGTTEGGVTGVSLVTFTGCELGFLTGCYVAVDCSHAPDLYLRQGDTINSTRPSFVGPSGSGLPVEVAGNLTLFAAQSWGTFFQLDPGGVLQVELAAFDVPDPQFAVSVYGGELNLTEFDGNGSTGACLLIPNGKVAVYGNLPTIVTGGADCIVGGTAKTWAEIGAGPGYVNTANGAGFVPFA